MRVLDGPRLLPAHQTLLEQGRFGPYVLLITQDPLPPVLHDWPDTQGAAPCHFCGLRQFRCVDAAGHYTLVWITIWGSAVFTAVPQDEPMTDTR